MDGRLQKRYQQLVQEHLNAVQALAAGLKALPGTGRSFASTQAAWRFFNNERVTLPALAEPLRATGRQAAEESDSPYVLLVHDWSKLDYFSHESKTDQLRFANDYDWGYELTTALLVNAGTGHPLAPMEMELLAADGVRSTRKAGLGRRVSHLEQVLPIMQTSRRWGLAGTVVHVIDREADSLLHFRQWSKDGHWFLVRAKDNRRVKHDGQSRTLREIVDAMRQADALEETREVDFQGRTARQLVGACEVVLDQPAWERKGPKGLHRVPGPPLTLRLVVVELRNAEDEILSEWLLLSNVSGEACASELALWYYWRWRIESFFKLLKTSGMQVESWQQESAGAIARRLLVACMACVTVWHLERQTTPAARECQRLLIRLSGRQMKRKRPVTASALLAGLHILVSMLYVLEHYTPDEIRQLVDQTIPVLASTYG